MFVRALAITLCLATSTLPAFALAPIVPQEQQAAMTVEELMTAAALDQLFSSFAETIEPEDVELPVVGAQLDDLLLQVCKVLVVAVGCEGIGMTPIGL